MSKLKCASGVPTHEEWQIELLAKALEECGLDDAKLADYLNVSRPTIERWRNKRNYPHPFMIPGILRALKEIK